MMIKRREVAQFGRPGIKGSIAVISGIIGFIGWSAFGLAFAYIHLVK